MVLDIYLQAQYSRDRPQDEGQEQSLPLAFGDSHGSYNGCDVHESDVDGHGPVDGLVLPVVHDGLHRVLDEGDRVQGQSPPF